MTPSTIEKALIFFEPYLSRNADIVFYGGEPLLAFDSIKYAVSFLNECGSREKKLKFSINTNGSLLTDEMLNFFDIHRFSIMLSFDGLTQDIERKQGSLEPTRRLIRRISKNSYPGIKLFLNSVFSPATVKYLSTSLKSIIESGVTEVQFSLANSQPWDEKALLMLENELAGITGFLATYYREERIIPLINFRTSEERSSTAKTFVCDGGRRRMTVGPEEDLWGCSYFHGYLKNRKKNQDFQRYWFGKLDDFIKNHETVYPRIIANYDALRQDCFSTGNYFCFICEDLQNCTVCPVDVAYATNLIGIIPSWICRLNRTLNKGKFRFLEEIERI